MPISFSCLLRKVLPDRESNPGLPRDRRGYSPLYYRGLALVAFRVKVPISQSKIVKTKKRCFLDLINDITIISLFGEQMLQPTTSNVKELKGSFEVGFD